MASVMAIAACGRTPDVRPDEPWPLTISDPAVIAYAAVDQVALGVEEFATDALGWRPDGLAEDRPVVLVHFDKRTYGGSLGVLFPLRDERAFLASLERAPSLEALGNGRYRLHIPAESTIGMALAMASRLDGSSPLDAFNAMANAASAIFPLHVEVRDEHALVAPSFEGLGVCTSLLRTTGGFVESPAETLVVSLNLDRVRVIHAETLRAWEDRLRSLVSGVQSGGALMGMMAMASRQDTGPPPLPVNWEMVWALKEMLQGDEMEALQLRISLGTPVPVPVPSEAEDEFGSDEPLDGFFDIPEAMSVRIAFSDDSRIADVLETITADAEVEGALFTLRVDPERFPRAFAEWCRPLAEVVKGEGPPCDRYLDDLVSLLSGWDGLLTLRPGDDGSPMLLLGMASDQALDSEALTDWLEPFLASARIEGLGDGVRAETLPDGRRVFMDAQGEPTLTVGQTGGVLWIAPGASGPPDVRARAAVEAALADPGDGGTPGLRISGDGVDLALSVQDRELGLDLRVREHDR
jgi:hypothetical protein